MNKYRVFVVIAVLVLASLACQAVTGLGGGGNGNGNDLSPTTSDDSSPTAVPSVSDSGNANEGGSSSDSKFPMTEDAYNVTEAGGTLLYYTKMSGDDVMKFYRDTYTAQGYTERELLTVVSGGVFSMVFDGDPSGKSVVIQSVDMGDGSRTVAIRLEDV